MAIAVTPFRKRELAPAAEPNVIPFIDVLLVLLIIFMVTAPKPTVDLKLDLPPAHPIAMPVAIPPTIVDLRDDGAGGVAISINQQRYAIDSLSAGVLQITLANNSALTQDDVLAEGRVYVRADQSIAYGAVVAVLDQLQHDGFAKVGVFAQMAEDA